METTMIALLFLGGIVAIFALSTVVGSFFPVEKECEVIVQWLEKFAPVAGPGSVGRGYRLVARSSLGAESWRECASTVMSRKHFGTVPVVHFARTTRYRHVPSIDS